MPYSDVEARPIQELCKVIDCEHKTAPYVEKSDFLVVRTSNVRNGQLVMDDIKYTTKAGYDEWTQRAVPQYGDVLFTREAPAGESCLVPADRKICMGQRMVMLRPNRHKVDPLFLSLILATEKCKFDISRLSIGSTVSRINISDIKKLKVAAPPLPEQKKVAQILSTWDKAIATTEKLLANGQQQKKALMQQLLTGKRRLIQEGGVQWRWLKADELFRTVSKRNNSEDEQLLAVTQDQGVVPRSLLERRVVMPDGSTHGYKLVVPGNFIISLRSFQGGLEYSSYRGLVSPAYTVLAPVKQIEDDFYRHYFKSYDFIGHLAVAVIGIRDGKQISWGDFSFLKLPNPSIEEQRRIAVVLNAADREIEALQKNLDCLLRQKKALMQGLLTGRQRVSVEPEFVRKKHA